MTKPANVIPAKAGIHFSVQFVDSGLRWNDTQRVHRIFTIFLHNSHIPRTKNKLFLILMHARGKSVKRCH